MSEGPLFLKKDYATLVDDLLESLKAPKDGGAAITDATEGSVLLTLVEAFARELALTYAQLAAVRRQGYLETSDGKALDQVVALVGVQRRRAGHASGQLRFSSADPVQAEVIIPAGALVANKDGLLVETTEEARLLAGERAVHASAVSVATTKEDIAERSLSTLVRPILGVDSVQNPRAFLVTSEPESDESLRARARFALRRNQSGTLSGIEQAVRSLGIEQVMVSERLPEQAGVLDVVVSNTALDLRIIRERVDRARPAGVHVNLTIAKPVKIVVSATPVLAAEVPLEDEERIRDELTGLVTSYVGALGPNTPVSKTKLAALIIGHPEIHSIAERSDGELKLELKGVSLVRSTTSGELSIEGGEYASIHRVVLELSPPSVSLQVDIRLDTAAVRGLEGPLKSKFDDEYTKNEKTFREYKHEYFKAALSDPGLSDVGLVVHVTRPTTGQRVTLREDTGFLRLQPRERLQLRSITFNPSTGGG